MHLLFVHKIQIVNAYALTVNSTSFFVQETLLTIAKYNIETGLREAVSVSYSDLSLGYAFNSTNKYCSIFRKIATTTFSCVILDAKNMKELYNFNVNTNGARGAFLKDDCYYLSYLDTSNASRLVLKNLLDGSVNHATTGISASNSVTNVLVDDNIYSFYAINLNLATTTTTIRVLDETLNHEYRNVILKGYLKPMCDSDNYLYVYDVGNYEIIALDKKFLIEKFRFSASSYATKPFFLNEELYTSDSYALSIYNFNYSIDFYELIK